MSVVVPTTGSRQSLLVSVASALQPEALEVIVVANGPRANPLLLERVEQLGERVRVLVNPEIGCGPARQMGVENARGEWVAFLDDDDLWLEDRLRRQLQAARSGARVITCVSIWVLAHGTRLLPGRRQRADESILDFVCIVRRARHGLLSPPSLLIARGLLEAVPWWPIENDLRLDRHEDAQWAARLSAYDPSLRLGIVDSPLVVVTRTARVSFSEQSRDPSSRKKQYADEVFWYRHFRGHMSLRARLHFYLGNVLPLAPTVTGRDLVRGCLAPSALILGLHRRRSFGRSPQ